MAAGARELSWAWLGRVPYRRAAALQLAAREAVGRGEAERLFLLEHPHVYTLGRSARRGDVRLTAAELVRRGIELEECDRGGQVTYHGPGQLVGYPVLDLKPDRRDVRRYVGDLQRVLIDTLASVGIEAEARPQPELGVWVGGEKIASIGVHLSRWITTHGFALNVAPDLELFSGIVPCGLPGVRMTSIARLTGSAPPLDSLAAVCARALARVFERRLEPLAIAAAGEGA